MKRCDTPWHPDRVVMLRQLRIVNGLSAGEIAKQLSRLTGHRFSRNAVISKLDRMGIEPPAKMTGRQKQTRAQHAVALGKSPVLTTMPAPRERGAERGDANVAHIDREPWQCSMFVGTQSGAMGLICGRARENGKAWCSACAKLAFIPLRAVA